MKDFIRKKGIYIAIAAVLIAIVSSVTVAAGGGRSGVFGSLSDPFWKPLKSAMTSFVGSLEKIYDYMYRYDSVVAENEKLKSRVAELEDEYRSSAEIDAENDRLRKLLGFTERRSDDNMKLQPASVIAWSASNFSSSFTISRGSSSGIAIGNAVINETGYLVGQITEATASSSTVTTVLDTTMSVGASVYETGRTGVAEGDFALLRRGRIKLSYLGDDAEIVTGNTVLTSGKGGVYPRGLVIGRIESLSSDGSGLDTYAVVSPSADITDIAHVFVVTDFTAGE